MLISLTKYRSPNNTIRVVVAMSFTANLRMFSPEIPAEQLLARVLLLRKFLAVKFNSQFPLTLC